MKILIAELLEAEARPAVTHDESELIHVSNITRGLGFFYEKIRNTLDYKEESLWAKNAILRILKRKSANIFAGELFGIEIIQELIRGRYLENDAIPESRANEVNKILLKYRMLWDAALTRITAQNEEERVITDWIFSIVASEIEETLRRSQEDALYLRFLYQVMRGRIEFPAYTSEETIKLQTYLASYRAMFQADDDLESWTLFKLLYPAWQSPDEDLIREIGRDIVSIKSRIEELRSSPYLRELDRIFKRRNLLVSLLRDILRENLAEAEKLLVDPVRLENSLRAAYEKRYADNRSRLRRTAFRAVLFILFTKILVALAVEIPYEIWSQGAIDYYPLAFNIFLPASVLLVASLSIKMPGEEQNFVKLLVEFNRLFGPAVEQMDLIRIRRRRPLVANISIGIFYVLNFILTFGVLIWLLGKLGFNFVSTGLLLIFLSIVSFFALRLRKTANELAAVEESEHWVRSLFDFFVFPIVEVGRFLDWGFKSLNVVVLVFDFLLEAPFHTLVGILEEWFSFLRERKESL